MTVVDKSERNVILNSLKEVETSVNSRMEIPEGYIEVKLSTQGKVGAPEVFHIRNFKVRDILALSLTDGTDTPLRLISVLNDMIWEDVDVAEWHEKEIEELMVYIFITFFKTTLEDVVFPYNEEDIQYLKSRPNGEDIIKAMREGKQVYRTDINIPSGVDTYDIDDNFKSEITITNKKTGFHVTFGQVKYGDQIKIRKWADMVYSEEESKFAFLKKQLEINNGILNNLKTNPEGLEKFIIIDKDELESYNEYTTKRLQTISEAVKLISIVDYNGFNTRDMSLSEKYELMSEDARIDVGMISKLNARQNKMPFGLKPEVRMRNPITEGVVSRPFSFRLVDILQAMQLSGNDDYDDGFDDED